MKLVDRVSTLSAQETRLLDTALDTALRDPRIDDAMEALLVVEFSELLDLQSKAAGDQLPR